MSGRSADGSGQTQPTQRLDGAMAQFEEDPPTQALPVHEIRASAAQAVPPSDTAGGAPGVPQPHTRKKWPIVVAVIAAIALIGAVIGGVVYSNKQSEALALCRTAVSEFSDARKALLATSDDSPAIQRFIRNVLGVDDILDAVAKAATAAEGLRTIRRRSNGSSAMCSGWMTSSTRWRRPRPPPRARSDRRRGHGLGSGVRYERDDPPAQPGRGHARQRHGFAARVHEADRAEGAGRGG